MGGLLGPLSGGGGSGLNFKAQAADIERPVSLDQTAGAYNKSQEALNEQAAFLNQLQMQGGIQNQSNVFNQLQQVASGQGPNPAQAMLANATGANVANQSAMMAGQRGAGSNVGMIGRQAAMQGSQAQQQAAGQAAALQAQQSLNALSGMGSIAGQQVGQQATATSGLNTMTQAQQKMLLDSIAQQNQSNVAMQSNINSSNAQLAAQAAQQQGNMLGNLTGAAGSAMNLFGGEGTLGGTFGEFFGGFGEALSGITGAIGTGASSALIGGAASGAGGSTVGILPSMALAAEGGEVSSSMPKTGQKQGPQSKIGQHFHKMAKGGKIHHSDGEKVPALVSPGEQYLKPQDVKKVNAGANPLNVGQRIPGRPQFPGNDYRNDKVPKTLESGGVVIPNSVMQSKDPKKAAAKFVEAVLAKQRKGLK